MPRDSPLRRVVVGTAGHIDHGKTTLVEALTGIDCDRWQEEKSRGITIDLGFAHLIEEDVQLGFVDVPGHERFVHNALAGLGGIDLMILVVAADEGIKPQTREHLAICSLLRIPAGLVALTKIDLVDDDLLELAELELSEELQKTPFAEVPILRVSSRTGEGLPELRSALLEQARSLGHEQQRVERPTRLPIDRAFHLRGLGVLTTGTLASGRLRQQDTLTLLPGGREARVRSIQVHGEERSEACAGERTSAQLTGVTLADVHRGMQLTTPDSFAVSRSLLARIELLPEAPAAIAGVARSAGIGAREQANGGNATQHSRRESLQEVRFHLYSSEILGRIRAVDPSPLEPGQTGIVEIRLRRPVVAVYGDRFILRRPSPQVTIGGGEVLDPYWRRRGGADLRDALSAFAGDRETVALFWIGAAGEGGLGTRDLARRFGENSNVVEKVLAALQASQKLVEVEAGQGHGRRWLLPRFYEAVEVRAKRVLREYFARQRLSKGMPKAEAVRAMFPGRAKRLGGHYLEWLAARKMLVVQGDRINLPGRGDELTQEESQLSRSILTALESGGLTPPAPTEICRQLGAKKQIFDGVLRFLHERRKVVRLPAGLFIAASTLDRLANDLQATGWQSFGVGQFKERFALTRKWAIPLLEHLDATGLTQRVGSERKINRR